jgi:ferredoxin
VSVRIIDSCVRCGACIWECPTEAIQRGALRPRVLDQLCTECYGFFGESQCTVVCPVDAVRTDFEEVSELGRKFVQISKGRGAQNTWIWRRA